MKLKLIAAAAISLACIGAQADVLAPVQINGTSFTDQVIGTIQVTELSNLTGSLFALDTVSGSYTLFGVTYPITISLQGVSFSGSSVGGLPSAGASFAFTNLSAGSYEVKASGTLTGGSSLPGLSFVGANYTLTAAPVPEPETYALLLAGLGVVGFVARRRRSV